MKQHNQTNLTTKLIMNPYILPHYFKISVITQLLSEVHAKLDTELTIPQHKQCQV